LSFGALKFRWKVENCLINVAIHFSVLHLRMDDAISGKQARQQRMNGMMKMRSDNKNRT
jgi:hypothetical protein